MNIKLSTIVIAFIAIFLFLLPFFWFHPGEMDLGGDNSRLYFYDPVAYLKNYASTAISPSSFGTENIGYYILPFVLFLAGLQFIFHSPTILIEIVQGLNFGVAFLSIYFIVKELVSKEKNNNKNIAIAALIAGLYYIFSQTSIQGWDKVLVTHNQFFLNPLMFLLLLKYFKTDKVIYLLISLLITFVFSFGFSFVAAPGFFAFYPLSFIFLLLYRYVILKKKIIFKHILLYLIAFILLQSFHIIPQIVSMLTQGSVLNNTIFSNAGKIDRGLSFFSGTAPYVKVSKSIMGLPQLTPLSLIADFSIIFPVIIIIGFLFNKSKIYLLASIFFLIVFLFETANVTNLWLSIYGEMFNLPGFSIFRNFYGQWSYTYLFYYALLIGMALGIIFQKIGRSFIYIFSFILVCLLFFGAMHLLSGESVNPVIWQSNNIHVFMKIDPNFQKAISYMRELPTDGKVLTLPMSDTGYQTIVGTNNGAYQGPSMISYLTGKKDFVGTIELDAYKQPFLDAVKAKDYKKIDKILTDIGVRYIFYDSDPRSYEEGFPTFPYTDAKMFLPKNQKEYKVFLSKLNLKKKGKFGYYTIYERQQNEIFPVLFTSQDNLWLTTDDNTAKNIYPELSNEKRTTLINTNGKTDLAYATRVITSVDTASDFNAVAQKRNLAALPYAFTAKKLTSPLYPLAIEKEKKDLQSYTQVTDDYIGKAIFYSDKRLNELGRWGDEIPILGNVTSIAALDKTWKEPSVFDFMHYKDYNYYEVSLVRYERQMRDLINSINQGNSISQYPTIENKVYIQQILSKQEKGMDIAITSSKQTKQRQLYLLKLTHEMFDSLKKLDTITYSDPKRLSYTIIPPVGGDYAVYLNTQDLSDYSSWSLLLNDKKVTSSETYDSALQKIADISLKDSSKNTLTLLLSQYTNLIDLSEQDSTSTFNSINAMNLKGIYLLSFDYNTNGSYYNVNRLNSSKETPPPYSEYTLHSNSWQKFAIVMQKGSDSPTNYFQIKKLKAKEADLLVPDNQKNNTISIKNISLVRIPDPQIVLADKTNKKITNSPHIIFKKINTAKYEIHISQVTSPFTLVFQNAFNNRWKLFPTTKNITGTFVDSYFTKQITELAPQDALLDPHAFETFGVTPIATDRHFSVNGYANAWVITPKDLNGKKETTLILEDISQRYFYIGFIISSITLFCVILYMLFRIIKK